MRNWQLAAGLLLAGAGLLLTWLDIGGTSIGSILLGTGIVIILWHLLRFGGG